MIVTVQYSRTPYLVVTRENTARKDVYGSIDDAVVRQAQLLRGDHASTTVVIAMHPIGSPGYLPAFSQLARSGFHVIGCSTRYTTGDAGLQLENALLDLAACVRDAKERLGYERVILAGWSGGGSLIAGYQAEAERKVITRTAAGEPHALAHTELIPADGVLLVAAHRSRHHLLTDFLDPSILDEDRPDERVLELDIYNPANPNQAPYSPDYVAHYRAAQRARNQRITDRAKQWFAQLQQTGRADEERCFLVQGTMADLRWVDPTIDPNDRRPQWSYLGDPRIANNAPSGLARFTTTRGWLSQWSLTEAQVDAVDAASRITVPTLVIVNTADDACPPSHPQAFFEALAGQDKLLHEVKGANHYYSGADQRAHLDEMAEHVLTWATTRGWLTD
jgi:alpha-beta hydrolase superfamily lysophospholipase